MSNLYIVATPIGNLEDITLRALRIFKEIDVIFAEDTREALKLLNHYDISKHVERYDEHSHKRQSEKVIKYLEEGKNIAYISDAGTPGISDPGSMLVRDVRDYFKDSDNVSIVPIPGPSALTSLVSVAGISNSSFIFLGFLPHKKGRETLFNKISKTKRTVVFYESPHRILKTLSSLKDKLEDDRKVIIGREISKIHEEIAEGTAEELFKYYTEHSDKVRGEFVVLIGE